jgi:hypothetical protein
MMSIKVFTLTALAVAVNGQVNPNPAGPKIKTISGGVVVEGTGLTVETPDRVVDVLANIDAANSMLGITRRQSPAPDDSASLPALVGALITKMDEVLNATVAGSNAATMRSTANVAFAYPAEVAASGGEQISIGGYNFIPGYPVYTATWTYTADNGATIIVESEPTAAASQSLLRVEAPAWPHRPVQQEYVASLSLTQLDVAVPLMSPVMTTFQAEAPEMTDLTDNVFLSHRDVDGSRRYRFHVNVSDIDGDVEDVRITATAITNSSFVTAIRDASTNMRNATRVIEVTFADPLSCGATNVTMMARDALGLNSTQTFELNLFCPGFVTIVRTSNSRSNYGLFGYGLQQMGQRLRDDTGENVGAFRAWNTLQGVRYVRITKISGSRHVGEFATFRLVATLSQTLYQTMMGCGQTNSYTRSASTTRWTARYSGQKVTGTLPLYNRYNSRQALNYVFLCGINTSNDDDHSLLAFTNRLGTSNDWDDYWRGSRQRGTVWSLYNDDFKGGRGWRSVQSGPGYKAGSYNAGGYEIAISDQTSH